jgi:hypothetical protein
MRRGAALIGLSLALGGPMSLAADRELPTYDVIVEQPSDGHSPTF